MAKQREKRKAGRPEGTYAKRRFRDTNLGRFIFLHEPLLYKVICPKDTLGFAPELFLIKKVIDCSDNKSFKTERYRKYLDEYEKHGLHVKRPRPITREDIARHRELTLTRAMNYVKRNKKEIEAREKLIHQVIQNAINRAEGR